MENITTPQNHAMFYVKKRGVPEEIEKLAGFKTIDISVAEVKVENDSGYNTFSI